MTTKRLLSCFAILLILVSPRAIASDVTTVTLHSTVRMHSESACTLGSIAEIVGVQADALSALPIDITPTVGEWTTIEVEQIRKLIKQTPSIRSGSVIVVGHKTNMTWRNALKTPNAPADPAAQRILAPIEPDPTIGDRVRVWLAKRYGVSESALKTTFRESDEENLSKSAIGKMVQVAEIGSSVNIKLRITIYDGDRFESSYTISAAVRVQREVLVAKQDIRRSEQITETMFESDKRWYPANKLPARATDVLGLATTTSLRAGDVITIEDVTQPIVIERGDIVSVRSIAGSIVANRRARALEDARDGEIFKLESIDRKERFTARASGRGQAVIAEIKTQGAEQNRPLIGD